MVKAKGAGEIADMEPATEVYAGARAFVPTIKVLFCPNPYA
jgi:hypothetical protein